MCLVGSTEKTHCALLLAFFCPNVDADVCSLYHQVLSLVEKYLASWTIDADSYQKAATVSAAVLVSNRFISVPTVVLV